MITPRRLVPLVAVLLMAASLAACGSSTKTPKAEKSQCTYAQDPAGAAKKVSPPPGNLPSDLPASITIATNHGDIEVSLDSQHAPCTVNAFVSLAKQGYFDNTHCHRLTTQGIYVLQCGAPRATGKPGDTPGHLQGGPGFTIKDELVDNDPRLQPCRGSLASGQQVCTYTAGTVAMANAGPDTGGSQFFLVYQDSPLKNAYTAFGKMSAAGVQVVRGIAKGGAYPPDSNGNTAPRLETAITSVK